MEVPITLRRWFVAHAVVDLAIGLPLLIAPGWLLPALGWTAVDGPSARLVGAALVAIGGQSWLGRDAGPETYRAMLNLKILWSYGAIAGLLVCIGQGGPPALVLILSTFLVFAGVWTHHRIRFKQMSAAAALDESQPPEPEDEPAQPEPSSPR
jgi:hypothetical protein